MLAEAGIQLSDWVHILLSLPHAKGKGMQAMGAANLLTLLNALRSGQIKATLVSSDGKLNISCRLLLINVSLYRSPKIDDGGTSPRHYW
jgi:hypothetical protein